MTTGCVFSPARYVHTVPVTFAGILNSLFFKPVLRPVIRVLSGLLAIPIFRFLLRRVFRVQASDVELERDLENWFRGSVILLAATKNFEDSVFRMLGWGAEHGFVWQTLLLSFNFGGPR